MNHRSGFATIIPLLIGLSISSQAETAQAEIVKGEINFPRGMRDARRYFGYWRVENGTVPTKDMGGPHAAVILEGLPGGAPEARTYTVKLEGFAANKPLMIIGVGSVVEISNEDKVAHDLSIPGNEALMPVQRLAPGSMRRIKFSSPGAHEIRDAQYPHLSISVIVVDHPHTAEVSNNGRFVIKDVPRAAGTLKVWAHGRFVHEEPINVSAVTRDMHIEVARQPQAEASSAD